MKSSSKQNGKSSVTGAYLRKRAEEQLKQGVLRPWQKLLVDKEIDRTFGKEGKDAEMR